MYKVNFEIGEGATIDLEKDEDFYVLSSGYALPNALKVKREGFGLVGANACSDRSRRRNNRFRTFTVLDFRTLPRLNYCIIDGLYSWQYANYMALENRDNNNIWRQVEGDRIRIFLSGPGY